MVRIPMPSFYYCWSIKQLTHNPDGSTLFTSLIIKYSVKRISKNALRFTYFFWAFLMMSF